jgi:protein-tyrosine phosphatase
MLDSARSMPSILVVCTGNICRSPIAEGFLRRQFAARGATVEVSSAGTAGWDGSEAMPESVAAAAQWGTDLSAHRARRLLAEMIEGSDLVVAMASEHRDAVSSLVPAAADRTFTLKELVRLLESLPPADPTSGERDLASRVAEANEARAAGAGDNPYDQDVADPLGLGAESYRAVAWELDDWCGRLVDGLLGSAHPAARTAEG